MRANKIITTIIAAVSVAALAGCSAGAADAEQQSATQTSQVTQASQVSVQDAWAKATEDTAMTAVFGTLTNDGSADVSVVSVSTEIAKMNELHEVANGEMQEVESYEIAAGESLALEPGAEHLMLMGLHEALKPGVSVTVTLTFSDDSTLQFEAIAKDFAGANESYEPEASQEMDHSGSSDH